MNPADLLEVGSVALDVRADGKRQALTAVAGLASRKFDIPAAKIIDALMTREAEGSTGAGRGVALPHARLPGLDRMRAVFVRLETPIAFDAVDDQPVDLLFALFAPIDAGSDHLRALARVSRLLRQNEVREHLRQAHTADALYAMLVQEASVSAA
ncbi:MAG: PTS sugar transporter subunit IIA [Caulobacteraceae bacterium]